MFRLSLHLGPLHVEVGIGAGIDEPLPYEEAVVGTTLPSLFTVECVNGFEEMAEAYDEGDW